jgi:hypothetical protein
MLLHLCLALVCLASAKGIVDPPELGPGPDRGCELARVRPAPMPDGCLARLDQAGVAYRRVALEGVETAIEVDAIGGVAIEGALDCRLAAAILAWAPELRARGIRELVAMSIHRPNARVAGSHHVSGHAHALALDLGAVRLDDGRTIDVLNGWVGRERGADPCASGLEDPLRGAVCAAIASGHFQIVLTPHHDAAHANHVHLEVRPSVDWSYVR